MTERRLSEEELNREISLSMKREILAYLKDGVPRSKKIDDLIEFYKAVNCEQSLKQASFNGYIRALSILPPNERVAELKKLKQKLLP